MSEVLQEQETPEQYFDRMMNLVEEGRSGKTVWIPLPFNRLSQHLGVGKKIYSLIGGDPGTGKSAFTHLAYILGPYNWYRHHKNDTDIKLKIILRSMERSKEYTIGKWVCMRLLMKYGIVMDVPTLFGWGSKKSNMPDEIYQKIVESKDYFYEMQEIVEIVDGMENPTGIYNHLTRWAMQNGKLVKLNQFERAYIPNNPNLITVFIIDHIGKLKTERDFNDKAKLDKMSEYISIVRDLYGFTPVVVSQFNRSLSDSTRRTRMSLMPEAQDFKGSSNMYEDCDVAITLFNPHRYHMPDFMGYQVQKMVNPTGHNRFRAIGVLKNTYGIDDFHVGMQFVGEVGLYRELPKPDQISAEDYTKYTTLSDLLRT
jgi:hypothetical protein